jgi:hypothetical protein
MTALLDRYAPHWLLGTALVAALALPALQTTGPAIAAGGKLHPIAELEPFYGRVLAGTPVVVPATPGVIWRDVRPFGAVAGCRLEPGATLALIRVVPDGGAVIGFTRGPLGDCPAAGRFGIPGEGDGLNQRLAEMALALRDEGAAAMPGPPSDLIATGL